MSTHDGLQKENQYSQRSNGVKRTTSSSSENPPRKPLRTTSLLNVRDTTPVIHSEEEMNQLHAKSYFMAPTSVILDSLNGSSYPFMDRINAYRLLSSRIHIQAHRLYSASSSQEVAVQEIQTHISLLLKAMRRDISYSLQGHRRHLLDSILNNEEQQELKSHTVSSPGEIFGEIVAELIFAAIYFLTLVVGIPCLHSACPGMFFSPYLLVTLLTPRSRYRLGSYV